jgi:inorganic pyrophosphatase/exopolyphosphatase
MNIIETYFKYQDKIYKTSNLDKKLKRMKLTLTDIELIDKPVKVDNDNEINGIIKHHFRLPNGHTITSIYDNLKYLNINDYEQID